MPWMDNFSHFLPQNETNVYLKILNMKQKSGSDVSRIQSDQIWRFIGLWATFKSFWQQ